MRIFPGQRCVVVGVDGSPNSLAALRRAATEAQRRHARLDVLRVLPRERPSALLGTVAEWLLLRRLVARELPAAQHITTRLHIGHGEPAAALIKAAQRAELLVIGARAHSEHGTPLGGPTVPAVLSGAPCEVVICADHATAAARETS
jgi:nucleotide-binding universal stress UspA family protein